ncbi:MAG TPA: hypothetical protein VMM13_17820 [Euzebya sp.]|nr:hypothetical protein [Euzebya sp.]
MSISPSVSYVLSRTVIGVGLGIGVALVAGWSLEPHAAEPNTSSIPASGGG